MGTNQDALYDISRVNVDISNENILNVRKLKFHKGAIYGVVGPAGSGKTTMLKLLSGLIKESSGEVKYDNSFFKTNWMGKAISNPEIKFVDLLKNDFGKSIPSKINNNKSKDIFSYYSKKMNINRLLNNKTSYLSKGELAFANLSLALEDDPRVLIIDDYGIYFDNNTEINFRKKIQLMNKNFGTTIILSSISDKILKLFTSVNIYLENGYVSKIRAGSANKSANNKYKTSRKKYKKSRSRNWLKGI